MSKYQFTNRERLLEIVDQLHQGLALLDWNTVALLPTHQPTPGLSLSSWQNRGQREVRERSERGSLTISNLAEILPAEIGETSQTTQLILARLD